MRTVLCLFGLVFAVGAQVPRYVDPLDVLCEGRPSGSYIQDTSACTNEYIQCHRFRAQKLACPPNLSFSPVARGCIRQEDNPLCDRNSCKDRPDGLYADAGGNCRQYLSCIAGWPIVIECVGEDDVWNDEAGRCMPSALVKPPCGTYTTTPSTTTQQSELSTTTEDNPCSDLPDGAYTDPEGRCNRYMQCSKGWPIVIDCLEVGHVWNDLAKRCMHGSQVPPPCGDYTTTESTTESTTPENNPCRDLSDGAYADPEGRCNRYMQCSKGWPIAIDCLETDHVWNDLARRCMHRSQVSPPCGDYTTTPSTTPEVTTPENNPCRDLPDGAYADPEGRCNRYMQCSKGWPIVVDCFETGHVWNDLAGRCMQRSLVPPPCGDYTTTPSTTASTTTTAQSNPPTPIIEPDYCSGLANGNYAAPGAPDCATFYIQCHTGVSSRAECPNSLSFDRARGSCVRVDDNLACEPSVSRLSYSYGTNHQHIVQRNPCRGLPDGDYADPSGNCGQYMQCAKGWPIVIQCQSFGHVWNDVLKRCMHTSLVDPPCGEYTTTPPTTTTPSTTTPSTTTTTTTRQSPTTTTKPDQCYGRPSGNYLPRDVVCSTYYIQCHSGVETVIQCPDQLSFDPRQGACTRVANNPSCENNPCYRLVDGHYPDPSGRCSVYLQCSNGWNTVIECLEDGHVWNDLIKKCQHRSIVPPPCGEYTTTPSTTTPSTTTPSTTRTTRLTTQSEPRTTPSPPFCYRRRDGGYLPEGVQCSTKYIQCHNGVATQVECPYQLSYDAVKGSCVRVRHNSACQSNPCYILDDGLYADPSGDCHRYMRCRQGWAFFVECDSRGLVWNQVAKTCTESHLVVAPCGTYTHPPTTTVVQTTSQPNNPRTTTTNSGVSCRLIEIGGIVDDPDRGCSPLYYQCLGSRFAIRRFCAPGTFWDAETMACDFRSNIRACGGSPPTTGVVTTTEPIITTPGLDFVCRRPGMFANPDMPCDSRFIVCDVALIARTMSCAVGTYFDDELGVCLRFNRVPACSGTPRPPTTMPDGVTPDGGNTLPPVDYDCREPGNFPDPAGECSDRFVVCDVGGFAFYMDCAAGTYFDQELEVCLFFYEVPDCVGTPRPPPTVATTPTTQSTTRGNPTTPPPFACPHSGNFAPLNQQCSPFFWQCHGVRVTRVDCPDNLSFDSRQNSCVRVDNNAQCQSTNACFGLADGLYAAPNGRCTDYMRCVSGWPVLVECEQPGHVWNDDAKQCTDPSFVPLPCGELINTTRRVPVTTPAFSCRGRSVGNHARPGVPCQPSFWQCHGASDFPVEIHCPGEGRYSARLDKCTTLDTCF